jgi:hypothetical protein
MPLKFVRFNLSNLDIECCAYSMSVVDLFGMNLSVAATLPGDLLFIPADERSRRLPPVLPRETDLRLGDPPPPPPILELFAKSAVCSLDSDLDRLRPLVLNCLDEVFSPHPPVLLTVARTFLTLMELMELSRPCMADWISASRLKWAMVI